jgi:hypothetical protein
MPSIGTSRMVFPLEQWGPLRLIRMHATTDGTFQLCAKWDIPTLTPHALQAPRILKIAPTRTNGCVNPKLFPKALIR